MPTTNTPRGKIKWTRTPKRIPKIDPTKRITPEQYAEAGTEHAHQTALFIWAADMILAGLYPELRWLAAIPNGGMRHIVTANKLKAEGVKAGFPDVFFPVPRGNYFGLFMELKKPKKGRVADEQNDWRDYLNSAGYNAEVCYGWIEARDTILRYINRN